MEGMTLNVYYSYPGIVSELDKKIINFFEKEGFKNWASGYDFIENKRELAFDYKDKNEKS